MDATTMPKKLWEHPNPRNTNMWRFMQGVNKKHNLQLKTFWDLFDYSLSQKSSFWTDVFEASNFIHEGTYARAVDEAAPIDAVPPWFEGVRLCFAENMLYSRSGTDAPTHRGTAGKEDAKIAVTEVREGNSAVRHVSWQELRKRAGRLAAAMKARGVGRGDRVVVVGANSVETLLVWIAASWLGAIFSASSTDMGVQGILQRTVQVDPKLLFFDDAALYNGKTVDLREKMADVVNGLKDCREFTGVVSIRRFAEAKDISQVPRSETWDAFLAKAKDDADPEFVRVGFNEPHYICYSSGTTGMPKAIVHSTGGMWLSYFKEASLHEGHGPDTVGMQYTTVGWIMYVAAVGILQFGSRAVLYDGSPFQPDPLVLIKVLGEQKVTKFGTSPRWMLEILKLGISPREQADLSNLRIVTTTGMVLSDQLFDWFYEKGFPQHVHLANISGGTDIAGCFGLMNPLTPVYKCGVQGPSLGVDVRAYDALLPDGPGKEVPHGTPGELVAVSSFPNIPCFFWGDKKPGGPAAAPGSKYHSAYFNRFDHMWSHGDFVAIHPITKSIAFLGRADGVLNPSGVRFGSAEIYGVIERNFMETVQDSLCVGQRRPQDNDESVLLFLLMKPGHEFNQKLVHEVKAAVRRELSKRHVPKYIFSTPEIPATVNGKKVELPVKQIVCGSTIKPSGSLANPNSLNYYYQFAKVEELVSPRGKL